MKLKIAICDDDASARTYLQALVADWAKKNRHLAGIRLYSQARQFLFDYSEEKDFDILLLDIEMPEVSGVELAKQIRRDNTNVQIIFITGFYEYFSDGFDVSALHYLIKPVDGSRPWRSAVTGSMTSNFAMFPSDTRGQKAGRLRTLI